ncbi:MAG: TonB-dependent receptor [Rubrivivax sp.]|nr:TonB-dependent receptor [Rubrivivax sp.]
MFKKTKVCTGVLIALGGGLTLAGLPAFAQTAERVEITGSRIKTFEVESASPVVSVSAESIKVEGVRSVEQLLNNLPQVFADQGGQVSNGASGTATVNLRNFGSARTLVLINGRRMPAGSPRDPSTDLNQIPISLIRRVEVLTGGASAIYGSDAVAGVVNFIMRDNFEGVQIDFNHQFYQHKQDSFVGDIARARGFAVPGDKSADAKTTDFSVTLGGNFAGGKGNATAFFAYKKEDALLQSERDFTSCALNQGATNFICGGSGTSYPGRFTDFSAFSKTVADAAGNIRDYNSTTDIYNFGPLNYLQRPSERYSFSSFARYEISPAARVYAELSFHDDQTVAQIAPSGLFFFGASGVNSIKYENPFLSAAWKDNFHTANLALGTTFNKPGDTTDLYIARRNVEGGGRQDDIRHTSYRAVLGMKGDLGSAWSYDASTQVGRVLFSETYKNDFSNIRIARALDVVTDPATGNPVCRSALDGIDPSCVPYNIWALGKVTPEALAYLQTPGFQRGTTSQTVVTANVTGDLGSYGIKSPLAKNGMFVVLGAERRGEKLTLDTDTAFTTGDLAGQGGPTIGLGGQYSVRDIYAELRFPLIEKRPFAEYLNLTGSYRNSDYSTGQKTNTFGIGLEFAPISEVKLRASYQEAARAANVVELFSASGPGLYDMESDPCASDTPSASLAECARTGVTAAQYGKIPDSPAGQYNAIFGGNANLKPEESKSYTLGIVFSPMKNMSLSLDYFDMKIDGVVGTAPPATTLAKCLATGDPAFCGLITRDAVGSLWVTPNASIVATNQNLGSRHTKGVDVGFDYSMKLAGLGGLDFSFLGTKLNQFTSVDIPGDPSYDCAGLHGDICGTPMPKWRHKLRTTWSTPYDLSLALTWRHISSVDLDIMSDQAELRAVTQPPEYRRTLAKVDYFDIAASYNINKNLTARLIVNNLLDKDPPIRTQGAGFTNGNTYPVVYDAMGRKIGLNLTATF